MDPEVSNAAATVVAAVGGGGISLLVGRLAIQSWFKRQDEDRTLLRELLVEVTTIKARLENLGKTEERTHKQDTEIAVLSSRVDKAETDLNGLGRKLGAISKGA